MLNDELKRNEDMIETLDHVSKTCVGSYGYLTDIMMWLSRKGEWKRLYESTYECTACHQHVLVAEDNSYMPKYKYCPYCGVVMKGV